jgi:hypothetical protein
MAMKDEEIEGLANRLALLVSDDGEADNAGRAVGAQARRMGLSGGQLKGIFLAGIGALAAKAVRLTEQNQKINELEADLQEAREALLRIDALARSLQRERDALRGESEQLHEALDRRRTSRQVRFAVGIVILAGLAGGTWLAVSGRALRWRDRDAQVDSSPFFRSGIVHEKNVVLRKTPDASGETLAVLTEGTQLVVKRTLWHNLEQWVEVEVGGQTGFVLSTEVNLS